MRASGKRVHAGKGSGEGDYVLKLRMRMSSTTMRIPMIHVEAMGSGLASRKQGTRVEKKVRHGSTAYTPQGSTGATCNGRGRWSDRAGRPTIASDALCERAQPPPGPREVVVCLVEVGVQRVQEALWKAV
jgi:hypothetical protein